MPDRVNLLLQRLADIARALEQSGHALALLGLGSVGRERDRLDDASDLDFFALVEPGHKTRYLQNLDWLTALAPVAFHFQNTVDGFKLLYADGVFCEFAVFEPHELAGIPFAPGRVVWKRPGFDDALAQPSRVPETPPASDPAWLLGEALTNLYVGLCRLRRGEILSATRFIQHYAVDHTLQLARTREPEQPVHVDPFVFERRLEKRLPVVARLLPAFVPGYRHNREAARTILAYLEHHFTVNPVLAGLIRQLAAGEPGADDCAPP